MARRRPQICRVDQNHEAIVRYLRACGWTVTSLAKVGGGAPDIVVGVDGLNLLFEIKMPGEKLNESEVKWHKAWRGTVYKVEYPEEAQAFCVAATLLGARQRLAALEILNGR